MPFLPPAPPALVLVVDQQPPPPPAAAPKPPADSQPELDRRVRFKVTVTADDTVRRTVFRFLELIDKRNQLRARLEVTSPVPEVELVKLFNTRPKLPQYSYELGVIYVRLNEDRTTATIEYCLRRCEATDAPIVSYSKSLDDFLLVLNREIAALAKKFEK